MNQALESEADKLCRDVGIATMLAGVMPGLGALTGLVVMPLMEPEAETKWGAALGFLAVSLMLFGLGVALRRRVAWSFRVAQVLFSCASVAGFMLLFFNDETEKVAFTMAVLLPLLFVAGATKAKRAVDDAKRARLPERMRT